MIGVLELLCEKSYSIQSEQDSVQDDNDVEYIVLSVGNRTSVITLNNKKSIEHDRE